MVSVIIVAGGKGLRMGENIPKQFIPINGIPILMRTIDKFHNHPLVGEVIVVLPLNQVEYWQQLCEEYDYCAKHKIAIGGDTRYFSVKSGLSSVSEIAEIVLVHDAVRPFVSDNLIHRVIDCVGKMGAVIPVIGMVDSVREIKSGDESISVDRAQLRRVQTPQGFDCNILKLAYDQPYSVDFTDDASVVESNGNNICLVDGDIDNIKITTKFDMLVGRVILNEIAKGY